MPITRQDAWSQDEDLLLAEVVLRHIRDGGTQLQAFEEVGRQLSRTSAACGFRWNSFVRKQYQSGIELAKKQRKETKKQHVDDFEVEHLVADDVISSGLVYKPEQKTLPPFPVIIDLIKGLYEKAEKQSVQVENIEKYEMKIKNLEKQSTSLVAENEKLSKELRIIEEDYRALIEIMERARKMVVLQEEDRQQKVKFQMDKNGNLERVEK
ncbi:RsfA family transcriptional regulator [Bacillus sp. 1NLA3E]|uniref:RsfA family transcriptional regulator n=1 Tax=Bacillus sp. 1NLA3E TaxID=666686 RepID=UPI000247E3BF|nr:RsfA family transcriptional regulator [Bacillus sp. 1NLA3E]AGK52971.1 spore coat protein regulator protein YlbO [Bacillus sp. 1NLA3E]